MKWSSEKPKKRGNYWYRRQSKSMQGMSGQPKILCVNSDLCVPQLNLWEYKEPVSVEEYRGQWAGPIPEPEDVDETAKQYYYNNSNDLASLLWSTT